jgi:drug/metabolite transporter (DMT)-like permease
MPLRLIPILLALAWGLNEPAVKIALSERPPFTLRAVVLGGAALTLLQIGPLERRQTGDRRGGPAR